jgi:hypothetical protein
MIERLKMIFDRIDIFVVCIVIGLCFCIVEAFLGIWDMFADCFFITLLAAEGCYILRCNEKLETELIETKEKLKKAEKESDTAIHQIVERDRTIRFYVLLGILWRKRWSCEHAKVNYCKHRITLRQLIDVMNHSDKMCDEISNKISELTKELNELDK